VPRLLRTNVIGQIGQRGKVLQSI